MRGCTVPRNRADRYYVKESAGLLISSDARSSHSRASARMPVEVLVFDRAYCHRVVWSSWDGLPKAAKTASARPAVLARARARADELARTWNAEDRADG